METTQHNIKNATQLCPKRNKTHIRHHSSASRGIKGYAFVYSSTKIAVRDDAVSYQERRVYGRKKKYELRALVELYRGDGGNLSHDHFLHHKTCIDWPGIETR
jgi:hypothetical protein